MEPDRAVTRPSDRRKHLCRGFQDRTSSKSDLSCTDVGYRGLQQGLPSESAASSPSLQTETPRTASFRHSRSHCVAFRSVGSPTKPHHESAQSRQISSTSRVEAQQHQSSSQHVYGAPEHPTCNRTRGCPLLDIHEKRTSRNSRASMLSKSCRCHSPDPKRT